MFKLLYRKFIQESVYQILQQSTWFYGRYDKTFWCVFSVYSVDWTSSSAVAERPRELGDFKGAGQVEAKS